MAKSKKALHEEIIDNVDSLVDLEKDRERDEIHYEATSEAKNVVKKKKAKSVKHGLELITDAIIKYKQSAGHPVSDKEEHRHIVYSDVEKTLKALYRQIHRNSDTAEEELRKDLTSGSLFKPLDILMNHYHADFKESDKNYKIEDALPLEEKDPELYKNIITTLIESEGKKWSKGKIAKHSTREGALELLGKRYEKKFEESKETYQPKEED